jgi:murein L,D-transpeptidase YafK
MKPRILMHRRLLHFLILFVLAVLMTGCSSSARPLVARSEPATIPGDSRAPLKLPLVSPRIEVRKAERKLLLFSDGRLVRTYHVGLGLSPVGDKERAGDHRTPEGDFYVFTKNAESAFYLSLGVSYPNLAHAKRGLRDGLINQSQYNQIAAAIKQKKTPLQRTRLGGDIFIHGNGSRSDWTWGCVALENEEIKELFDAVEVGTSVTIEP